MRCFVPVLALIAACSDSASGPPPRAACVATKQAAAPALGCPFPDKLPFDVSYGFAQSDNAAIDAEEGCSKDEASDTIGNPGGAIASVYLPDDQTPAVG